MASPTDVLTLGEAKAILRVANAQQYDDDIPAWVTGVSERMDTLVGPIVQRPKIERLDGGSSSVFLRNYPVSTIVSVRESGLLGNATLIEETPDAISGDRFYVPEYSMNPDLYGNEIIRRRDGFDQRFEAGRGNVTVTTIAGRYESTEDVAELYKRAAGLMLITLWRSQQDSVGRSGDFDVPQNNSPRFAVPRSVLDLFRGEVQDREVLIG